MSMISEQVRVIRVYEKEYRSGNTLGRMIQDTEEVLRNAADTIEELSAKLAAGNTEHSIAYYNNGWIPVTERLPEESGFYIVTKKQRTGEIQVAVGAYQQPFNTWSGNGNFKNVIAWQPLPEPYKGE